MTTTELDTTSPLGAAGAAYRKAAGVLMTELERHVVRRTLEVFPSATVLHVEGETNEDGLYIVRARRVTDAEGNIVAGTGPGSEAVEHNDHAWDDLSDELAPHLDWLGDLAGDGIEGPATLVLDLDDLTPPGPPSTLLVVDGVATCPRCGGTDFRYEESYPTTRTMDENEDGVLAFGADFDWTEGNSTPGVICENIVGGGAEAQAKGVPVREAFRECGAELDVPDAIQLEWRG